MLATLEPLPDRVEYPFHFSPANDGYAISYGPDWYLEIERGTDFQTGSQSLRWASGALRLQGDSWILAVHPSPTDTRHGEIYYDLTTNEMVGTPLQAESAPIGRWRVWQSKEAYLGQTGSPLIGVSAVELT
ncbi:MULTISPECIES: hypothetical protein [unclassified Rhizobium]|uniref:hypothetical protein n=1 Tax=unclassified Rhizobium TaxID=2613769 RepID=UPI002889B656|nr:MULTISPECIES: hypothetical protein [unclassified Rhizobium]